MKKEKQTEDTEESQKKDITFYINESVGTTVGNLTERLGKAESELTNLKKVFSKEMIEKQGLSAVASIEQVKSETAMTALFQTLNQWTKWNRTFVDLLKSNQEAEVKIAMLQSTVEPMTQNVNELRVKLSNMYPLEMRDAAMLDMQRLMEAMKEFQKAPDVKEPASSSEKQQEAKQ